MRRDVIAAYVEKLLAVLTDTPRVAPDRSSRSGWACNWLTLTGCIRLRPRLEDRRYKNRGSSCGRPKRLPHDQLTHIWFVVSPPELKRHWQRGGRSRIEMVTVVMRSFFTSIWHSGTSVLP